MHFFIHWSIFPQSKGIEALVPATPWLDAIPPLEPVAQITVADSLHINWTHPDKSDVFKWVVYYQYGNTWNYKILDKNASTLILSLHTSPNNQNYILKQIAVTAVDRLGNESSKKILPVK